MKSKSISIAFALLVLVASGTAGAQALSNSGPDFDAEDAVSPISIVQGPGVKVGEGTVLHPVLGVEGGYISNVFYTHDNPVGAGMLQVFGQLGFGSLSPQRLTPPGEGATPPQFGNFAYQVDLHASYDFMLSDNPNVTAQDGLGAGALLRGVVHPQQTVSLLLYNDYERLIRATNFESNTNTDQDINNFRVSLNYKPPGRTLSGFIYYWNMLDVFEQKTQRFADRFQNDLGARVYWQWLPLTRFFVDVSGGYFTGIGASSTKVSSDPLTAIVGAQTQLTVKTAFIGQVGYTNGFYASGPSYSSVIGAANLSWDYLPTGHVVLTYQYNYNDSLNANFYHEHVIKLAFQHAFNPFVFDLQPELHFREYDGITEVVGPSTRDDVVLALVAEAHYYFRDWIAATASYRFTDVDTDYRYVDSGVSINPSYIRHDILAGVRGSF